MLRCIQQLMKWHCVFACLNASSPIFILVFKILSLYSLFLLNSVTTSTMYYQMRKSPWYGIYLCNSIIQYTPATEYEISCKIYNPQQNMYNLCSTNILKLKIVSIRKSLCLKILISNTADMSGHRWSHLVSTTLMFI